MSASFGLAGCGAIDDLKDAISRWFDTASFPSGREAFSEDLPNAAPMISPEKIPKAEASKASKRRDKSARDLHRPQTAKLQKKPPTSNSTEAGKPQGTDAQSAPPASMRGPPKLWGLVAGRGPGPLSQPEPISKR